MKKIILILFSTLVSFSYSQNIKVKNWAFKYEYLPERPLGMNYKTCKVEGYSDASDGVKFDDKFVLIGEEYIRGFKNVSVAYMKSGVMIGGAVVGGKEEKPVETSPDLKVTVIFKNIELVDKVETVNKTSNLQTNQVEIYCVYKLAFNFPYVLRLTDVKSGKNLLDTLIDNRKIAIFPNEYRYDVFGNRVACNGTNSKPELDLEYNKLAKDLYSLSKKTLAQKCMEESKGILKYFYGFSEKSTAINFFWVKAKSKTFDVCDTTEDLMRSIMDTVTANAKYDKHVNWHCKSVKSDAAKLIRIWENMFSDPKYAAEFTDENDKKEFLIKMKWNLVIANLFADNFEKATSILNEVKSSNDRGRLEGGNIEQVIHTVESLIDREIKMYNKHKTVFNFN